MKQDNRNAATDGKIIRPEILQMIKTPAGRPGDGVPENMRTIMLLVLVEHIINSIFWSKLIDNIENEIRRSGSRFVLTVIAPEQEAQPVGEADGYLMIGAVPQEYMAEIQKQGKPMVWIDSEIDYYSTNHVRVNNEFGAYRLVRQAVEMGHRRLAFIGADDHLSYRQRYRGMVDCVDEYKNLDVHVQHVVTKEEQDDIVSLLTLKDRPTFVMTCSDAVATQVYIVAEQLMLQIPGDLSVAGFDNLKESQDLKPPLSTAEVPLFDMALTAVELVMKCIDNPLRPHEKIVIEPMVIMRESIRPPMGTEFPPPADGPEGASAAEER